MEFPSWSQDKGIVDLGRSRFRACRPCWGCGRLTQEHHDDDNDFARLENMSSISEHTQVISMFYPRLF